MNISGIRPTAGFYSYNSIKTNALHEEQNLEDSNVKENEKKEPEREFSREKQNFTSYDYAKNYRPDVTYQLNENPVNVEQLDIDKMKSDLNTIKQIRVGVKFHAQYSVQCECFQI